MKKALWIILAIVALLLVLQALSGKPLIKVTIYEQPQVIFFGTQLTPEQRDFLQNNSVLVSEANSFDEAISLSRNFKGGLYILQCQSTKGKEVYIKGQKPEDLQGQSCAFGLIRNFLNPDD